MAKNKKPRKAMDPRKRLEKDRIGYPTYKPFDEDKPAFERKATHAINFKTR